MSMIPKDLYTKQITRCIRDLIRFEDAKDFYSLDEIHQDKLVNLGLSALGGDIEIIIGSDANRHLAKILNSYDRDEEIELIKSIKESAREKFAFYFTQMMEEVKDDIITEAVCEIRRRRRIDQINGEVTHI